VDFHKFILNTQEYFKGFFNFKKDETKIKLANENEQVFSYESIIYLKRKLYCQEMEFKLETVEDAELLVDLENLSRYIQVEIIKKYQIQKLLDVCENMEILQVLYSNINELHMNKYFKNNGSSQFVFDMDNPIHINMYACCTSDDKEARRLFKKNWKQNKNVDSLHNYAECLIDGVGCKKNEDKACKLFKLNWEENNYLSGLNTYAYYLMRGIGCEQNEKEACELYKINWEQTDNPINYASCLMYGRGCEEDKKKAFELYKTYYKQNKNSRYKGAVYKDVLYEYAYCLLEGVGCEQDQVKAFRLFKLNWEENQEQYSLKIYINCLANGIGCGQDDDEVARLSVFLE
jgi:TPR repeat protein